MLSDKNISVLLHYYNKYIEYNRFDYTLHLLTISSIRCKYFECYIYHLDKLSSLAKELDSYFFYYNINNSRNNIYGFI